MGSPSKGAGATTSPDAAGKNMTPEERAAAKAEKKAAKDAKKDARMNKSGSGMDGATGAGMGSAYPSGDSGGMAPSPAK